MAIAGYQVFNTTFTCTELGGTVEVSAPAGKVILSARGFPLGYDVVLLSDGSGVHLTQGGYMTPTDWPLQLVVADA